MTTAAEHDPMELLWQRRSRQVFALLREAGISEREERLNLFRWIVSDQTVSSTNDLNVHDLKGIAQTLAYWKAKGELVQRAHEHIKPEFQR